MKEILLTKGKVALVDDEDYDKLSLTKWYATKSSTKWYAAKTESKNGTKTTVRMHRVICGCPDGMQTDHINGDGLDNRKSNLRICTQSQNQANKPARANSNASGYKGVSYRKDVHKWQAAIEISDKKIYLGTYLTPEEAGRAYDEISKKYYGEFARLNFPEAARADTAQGE